MQMAMRHCQCWHAQACEGSRALLADRERLADQEPLAAREHQGQLAPLDRRCATED